ncbi:MAG: hypothetical protein ACPG31_09650 [Planctomycetota bacterium]
MKSNRNNRGLIATTLLITAAAGAFGFGQGVRVGKDAKQQDPGVLPDPAAQRNEMIQAFGKMQQQLDSMDKTLKGIERINSAMLRLQFDASKKTTSNPHAPTPPPGDPNKITGPR